MDNDFKQAFNDTLFDSFEQGYYVGMMSGTSLDGLDAVICQFDERVTAACLGNDSVVTDGLMSAGLLTDSLVKDSDSLVTNSLDSVIFTTEPEPTPNTGSDAVDDTPIAKNKIIATHTAEFPDLLREVLLALCQPNATAQLHKLTLQLGLDVADTANTAASVPQSELDWFGWASREYGKFASQVVNELLAKSDINAESIIAIGCHGQTVRHRPHLGFSLQLVDPNIIAERTGISVVSDFRRRDMAVGGQGAPLVPAFHLAHFGKPLQQSHETKASATLIVVNLGGIANITVLPANQPDKIIGFDTGPANILLDSWYQFHVKHSNLLDKYPDYQPLYDKSGQWAQMGQGNHALLKQLLTHPYFVKAAPKSTGREDFNLQWLQQQIVTVETNIAAKISAEDVQATLTLFTVKTLSNAIQAEAQRLSLHALQPEGGAVIVCGGGAYNDFMLALLAQELADWHLSTSADFGIAPTWVEAMAFAWLAQQTMIGNTGNLPAATGASKAVVLGQVCFA